MGDFRASIDIKMTLIGEEYETLFWINYWPDTYGMDKRVRKWFKECWDDAHSKYEDRIDGDRVDMALLELEGQERMELKRLQEKYGLPANNNPDEAT